MCGLFGEWDYFQRLSKKAPTFKGERMLAEMLIAIVKDNPKLDEIQQQ